MKAEYPRLAQMALDILTIPATKADCEQAFSQAADLLESRRSLISVMMLAAICCVRSWLAEGFEKVKKERSECDSVANITRLLTTHAEDVIVAGSRPTASKAPSPLQTETSTNTEPFPALPASLRDYSIQMMDMDKDIEEDIEEDTRFWPN